MMAEACHAGARTLHVLLVEDNPADVFYAKEIVSELGFEVQLDVARDGEEAGVRLLAAESAGALPDLVLLDLSLPRKNGLELLAELRSHATAGLRDLRVIMLTHSSRIEDREAAEALGVRAFVTKPLDPARLETLAEGLGGGS